MNALSEYCKTFHLDPVKAMNLLQDYGLVSDNCVTVEDVAEVDCDLASRFCKLNSADLHAR